MAPPTRIAGKRVAILFDGPKCIHSRACVLLRPDVFVPNVEGEWIHPDLATPEEIAALALACPSGAIAYERLDGGPSEAPPLVNVARVREHGPLALHGDLRVAGESLTRATLCRCGASKNKPYCDGSHVGVAFAASGEPASGKVDPLDARNGRLDVEPLPNGPLRVVGNLEICSGTGRTVAKTKDTRLCRCGQSSKKPFCDGSHKAAGFQAP